MIYSIGPWQASTIDGEFCWTFPDGASGGYDLRSVEQCASKQVAGYGIFASAASLGSDYTPIGTDADDTVGPIKRNQLASRLGINGLVSNRVREVAYELATVRACPAGEARCTPLEINRGKMELWIAGQKLISRDFDESLPEWPIIKARLKRQIARLRIEHPDHIWRKFLYAKATQYRLADYRELIDGENEGLLVPETTFTDNFNRANNTNLGSNWVEVLGDWEIVNNRLVSPAAGGGPNLVRWATPFSFPDMKASISLYVGPEVYGHGVCTRMHATDVTLYVLRIISTGQWQIAKYVNGTFTGLGSFGSWSNSTLYSISLESVGSTHIANAGGQTLTLSDAIISNLYPGVWGSSRGGYYVDDFEAADENLSFGRGSGYYAFGHW